MAIFDDQRGGQTDAQIAARMTAAGAVVAASTNPVMDGTAAVGVATTFARGDHVHPSDTSRAPLASPVFTGAPRAGTATVLGTSGTVSLDPTLGQIFSCTPTAAITALNAVSAPVGAIIYIIFTTSGASSFNVTFNTNFKTTGVLATGTSTGKVFVIAFVGDGTNLNEVARTVAM